MTVPALRVQGVRVVLGGNEILRGVDLRLSAGTVLGVLGPSGAGKTTLFRVIVGELHPTRGSVFLGPFEVTREPLWKRARRGIGYVPQTPSVLFDLDVRGNLVTFERALRLGSHRPAEWAKLMDLGDRLDVRVASLSGGERRRLELVRALMAEPKVLVLDEPLTGMDPVRIARLAELLRALAARGAAVVLADHRIREALEFCDEAALFVDGRVEVVARPQDFAAHSAVVRRYLG
jgi:lipopolysaccharide export system ATP-binding protein